MLEERVDRLEAEVSDLRERLVRLEPRPVAPERRLVAPERPVGSPRAERPHAERPRPGRPSPEQPQAARQRVEQPRTEQPARPSRPAPAGLDIPDLPALEDLLGGRVLAWIGGVAIVVGLAFLMALGISQGWIGETARTVLGGGIALALIAAGVWLHERRARTDAALASFSAGVAGMFAVVTVAAQVYDLVPSAVGVVLALATGVVATSLALRWESQGIAGLGIVGAMLAPALAGTTDGGAILMLGAAGLAAVTVLVRMGWRWLSVAVITVAAPQWAMLVLDHDIPAVEVLAVVAGFGLIGGLAAVGHEVRAGVERLAPASALLLAFNALVVGGLGYAALPGHSAGIAWLVGVAVVHAAIGVAATRRDDLPSDLGLLAFSLAGLSANVAFALAVHGPARAIGWAVAGVAFAVVQGRRAATGREEAVLAAGLGGHLALGLTQALIVDSQPSLLLGGGSLEMAPGVALLGLAAACIVSGRVADAGRGELRVVLDAAGLALVAYITALTLDGVPLVLAYAAEAIALAAIGRRWHDDVATTGALANLGLGAVLALAAIPLSGLSTGVDHPGAVALGSAGVVAAASMVAWLVPPARTALTGVAGGLALYVVSVLVVTPFQPDGWAADATLLQLPVREQGQVVLSALWGVVGLAGLVTGLVRDLRAVRLAALTLLLGTVAKVFLFDLATLTSVYRVISFLALGLLLLLAAFAWQRVRPRALGDLREVPAGVR